jgi:hypothetical protein
MARLTEIADDESIGIGLAGSELPKRRKTPRVRSVEDLTAKLRATTTATATTQTQTRTRTRASFGAVAVVTTVARGAVLAAIIAAVITRAYAVVNAVMG